MTDVVVSLVRGLGHFANGVERIKQEAPKSTREDIISRAAMHLAGEIHDPAAMRRMRGLVVREAREELHEARERCTTWRRQIVDAEEVEIRVAPHMRVDASDRHRVELDGLLEPDTGPPDPGPLETVVLVRDVISCAPRARAHRSRSIKPATSSSKGDSDGGGSGSHSFLYALTPDQHSAASEALR